MHKIKNVGKQKDKSFQENSICFFRFQSIKDGENAFDALVSGRGVFCDLSDMEANEMIRFKDYMQGVCISIHATTKEICEDYIAYFPMKYHLQIFES